LKEWPSVTITGPEHSASRSAVDRGNHASGRGAASRKLFVIAGRCGRLANRLVLSANFMALMEEQGHWLINPTLHSYAPYFETTQRDLYCRYPATTRRSWLDVMPGIPEAIRATRIFFHVVHAVSGLNERLPLFGGAVVTLRQSPGVEITALDGPEVQEKIRGARLILVNGWNFRVPELIERYAEKIRAYFRPRQPYENAARRSVDCLRREADVVVGVHIRHGDYRAWREGKCFFPSSRYASWMHELAEQFPNSRVSFLICSDEPRNAQEFPDLSVGFGTGPAITDLDALAKCDYIFGPISTFSQWASFYGQRPLLHLHDNKARMERGMFQISNLREIP
jgi:hypothetical protein